MNSKEYKLPNGKKAVFEYDATGVGKVTLECMDELMSMIADRPHGEWKDQLNYRDGSYYNVCSECGYFDDERDDLTAYNFCPYCGAKMDGERKESE